MLNRWDELTRVLDGRVDLDNNPAELASRRVAIGRKIYFFPGSDRSAERAAALYSLIENPKLKGLDPEVYPHDVLVRIVDHPATRFGDLLRWI